MNSNKININRALWVINVWSALAFFVGSEIVNAIFGHQTLLAHGVSLTFTLTFGFGFRMGMIMTQILINQTEN